LNESPKLTHYGFKVHCTSPLIRNKLFCGLMVFLNYHLAFVIYTISSISGSGNYRRNCSEKWVADPPATK
jgi:hypothetical protein